MGEERIRDSISSGAGGNGRLSGKLNNLNTSLLVDPHRIPYMQINGPSRRWSGCDKLLFWIVPLFILFGISGLLLVVTEQEKFIRYETLLHPNAKNLDWDELIFTQLWGFSECLQFKDKNVHRDVSCRYENDPSFWSIHGIWPTRQGTEGPSFCSKVRFNVTQLDPIRPSLDQYWYEIDNSKQGDYFWSHEWTKHGSCAKEEENFSTELKYFSAALDLRRKYDLYDILKNQSIIPGSRNDVNSEGYSVDQISDAIRIALGPTAIPYVQCLGKKNHETNTMEYYLLAVELCFSKDLQQFVSCARRKRPRSWTTSKLGDNALPCPPNEPIKYFDASL